MNGAAKKKAEPKMRSKDFYVLLEDKYVERE